MCLCFLTDESRYFQIDLLGEYIGLSIGPDGSLRAREVYDVFFAPRGDWEDFRLLCLSPHNLLREQNLCVRPVYPPGAGNEDDRLFYSSRLGCTAVYSADTSESSVEVPGLGTDQLTPIREHYSGVALTPQARVPAEIAGDPTALEVMGGVGTVFELLFPVGVKKGKRYVFRLEVTPPFILGLPERIKVQDEPTPRWNQEASIVGPKTCRFNFLSNLDAIKGNLVAAPAANMIKAAISNEQRYRATVPLGRHRILLAWQPPVVVDPRAAIGCMAPVGIYSLDNRHAAAEWSGGSKSYWKDDIESAAREIRQYLLDYAGGEAKSKEAISAAFQAPHDNCSLLVDALAATNPPAVCCVSGKVNQFQAGPLSLQDQERVFESLATNRELHRRFRWNCFQVGYSLKYDYASRHDRSRIWWRSFKQRWAFWIALVSLSLSLLRFVGCEPQRRLENATPPKTPPSVEATESSLRPTV